MSEAIKGGSEPSPRKIEDIMVVPQPSVKRLGEKQLVDYHSHRTELLRWALNLGKDPEQGEGYAHETVKVRAGRADRFYRWTWEQEDQYTTTVTHDHANDFMEKLAYGDTSQTDKANCQKTLKMLFRWLAWQYGADEWKPEITFSGDNSTTNPRDYLTVEERRKVREAALRYGSIPSYNGLSPEERDEWKTHLSQRFKKPKKEITPEDWQRANSWKIPSLVWVSLDTGLRPVEVRRATTGWVDVDNKVLRIPEEESSKGTENWIVSLTDRTANALNKWLVERQKYSKYEDTDILWLTREATPYRSHSLTRTLKNLCEEAEIPTKERKMTWYSIRHSVGTYMSREEGLAAAQSQLRHKSEQTTMRYDQAPVEDRRDALNKMG